MRPADMDDIQLAGTARPRLAAVILDSQPDVLIAKTTTRCRRHIGVLPLPKATPARLRSAAISLPAGRAPAVQRPS
jgi:hypothetical protein